MRVSSGVAAAVTLLPVPLGAGARAHVLAFDGIGQVVPAGSFNTGSAWFGYANGHTRSACFTADVVALSSFAERFRL